MDNLLSVYTQLVNTLKDSYGYDSKSDDANFLDTPQRALKGLREIILPKYDIIEKCNYHLLKTFPCNNSSMVVVGAFDAISMCPHHLLPIALKVVIGYIPDKRVLGLSKFIRIGKTYAKQPILQEDYVRGISNMISSKLKPMGVGVYAKGVHGCMYCRGVLSDANTITTSVTGNFLNDSSVKNEFLSYVRDLI